MEEAFSIGRLGGQKLQYQALNPSSISRELCIVILTAGGGESSRPGTAWCLMNITCSSLTVELGGMENITVETLI